MYGVVAAQERDAKTKPTPPAPPPAPPHKDQSVARRRGRGLTDNIMDYMKRRFNPGSEEESEQMSVTPSRHRPEGVKALAQTTRFTPHEIKLMYRGFKQECPSGVVDEDAFKHIFSQFFPLGDASQYAHYVFNTIKHKQSGKVNFEEFLEILSRVARGSLQEKLSWVFTLYDVDGDGRISRAEMEQVVQAIYELLGRAAVPPIAQGAAKDHVDRIFHLMDTNADGVVTPDELARWCARDPAALRSLDSLDTVLQLGDSTRASCSTTVGDASHPASRPASPCSLPSPHSESVDSAIATRTLSSQITDTRTSSSDNTEYKINSKPDTSTIKTFYEAKLKSGVSSEIITPDTLPSVTHVTKTSPSMNKITTDFPCAMRGCTIPPNMTTPLPSMTSVLSSMTHVLPEMRRALPSVRARVSAPAIATVSGAAASQLPPLPTRLATATREESAQRKPKRRSRRPSPPRRR